MSEANSGGPFVSFVLLDQPVWDRKQYVSKLAETWGIQAEIGKDDGSDNLVWEQDGMMATVGLMSARVPDNEAEHNAANNYMWPDAVEVTKGHTAHLLVAVLPREQELLQAGTLLVKLCDVCLDNEHALGVYTSGTVFHPPFYREAAALAQSGALPILNWIYFGLRRSEKGICGYTFGLEMFCRDELEVLDSAASPQEVRGFLLDITSYLLNQNVILQDGETIGFSAEEKLSITRSPGVFLDGDTLKIDFQPAG